MLTRRAVILAKEEAEYGTDPTPTKADNAILAYSPKITPVPEKIVRDPALGTISKMYPLVGKRYVDFSFTTDLRGSGAPTTAPRWGDLLEALGFAEAVDTEVTYTPASASLKSVTIWAYFDGLLHKITGAVAVSCEIILAAGGIGKLNWTFRGIYAAPTDVVIPTDATYDSPVPEIVASTAFTLDSVETHVINQLSITIANDVALRGDIRSAAGVKGFVITGRTISGSFDPEAMLMATENLWEIWEGSLPKALSVVVGTGTGNVWTITAPAVTLDNIDSGDREGIRTFEIPLAFGLSSGDDELSLVHSS